MPSNYESFWDKKSFAVVGHSQKKPFPKLTYGALKARGKTVFAVDPSVATIEGDATHKGLDALPASVDAVVLEVPQEETIEWVKHVADAGIRDLWIHMKRDTPEALALANEKGINVRHGTCAVMYLKGGYHTIHKWINKIISKY